MKTPFKTIAIVGKYMQPEAVMQMRDQILSIAQFLSDKALKVLIEHKTAEYSAIQGFNTIEMQKIGEQADLTIVLGGDGTMLSVARSLYETPTPLIGINRGRFGFLTDLRTEDMLEALDRILVGQYTLEQRMLLAAQVIRKGEVVSLSYALNDVVIKSGLRLIELEVSIDKNFVYKQRSDGLILSTPTGTTAYALSAGGPILHPNLEAISLVPICPHTLSNRPIAVPSTSKIEVNLKQFNEAYMSFDGQYQVTLEVGDTILLHRAEKTISLLHPADYCYFDMLRNKLNWG